MEDGTYCGCDIDGELMADSVVLADRSVVDRTPENLAKPLWKPELIDGSPTLSSTLNSGPDAVPTPRHIDGSPEGS